MKKIYSMETHLVKSGMPVLSAMKLLSAKPHGEQFLMIVDDAGRLKGTLTDGDIRRALISGKDISGLVDDFMHRTPVFAMVSDEDSKVRGQLKSKQSSIIFLPILNPDFTINHIVVQKNTSINSTYALIMAGGFGKRLGKWTSNLPKPLVKVGDIPLIEHVLRQIENVGVKHIYISVHYLAELIEVYVKETGREGSVSVIKEEEPMGTAGAISMLPDLNQGNLIVTNCDLITGLDYNDLIDFHCSVKTDATVAVATHKVQIPFGVIKYDKSGRFEKIEEKPTISNYVAAGIYIFSSDFIKSHRIIGKLDMPDYISLGRSKGMQTSIFPLHEEWADIGRPEDLENAITKLSTEESSNG